MFDPNICIGMDASVKGVEYPERLAGKVAVVTGGASGIGLATTRRFVAEGARVVVGDIDAAGLEAVTAELGPDVAALRGDVRSEDDTEGLVALAMERFGAVDVLFANAGVGTMAPIVDTDVAEWMRVVEINLLGPLLAIKHAAPHMPRGGSIVITASLNAVQPARGMSAYCASKAAVVMLANVAAMELGPAGIRVNAVGPGLVRTSLTEGSWSIPGIVDGFVENAPLGGWAEADDIANLVAFLASDESRYVSGSLYLADGGAHTMRYPDVLGTLSSLSGRRPAK